MYQERVKYPGESTKDTILYIVLIVLGVFVLSFLSWLLSSLGVPGADLMATAVVAVWACTIFFRRAVTYQYSLMDTDLVVSRVVGSRDKTVFSMDIADIVRVGEVEKKCSLKTERCTIPTKKLRTVQIVYKTKEGEERRVLMQPSDKLLDMICIRTAEGDAQKE